LVVSVGIVSVFFGVSSFLHDETDGIINEKKTIEKIKNMPFVFILSNVMKKSQFLYVPLFMKISEICNHAKNNHPCISIFIYHNDRIIRPNS
jgi:hypothetical protein